ncbi:MAG: carbohydrate kinase [Chloroflexi bacterium]|nr:carbohydrate kinase [Chloroflexota bacterium]
MFSSISGAAVLAPADYRCSDDAEMTYSLAGIGELLWDIFPSGKELGGAPANFAYQATALGGEGLIVSCVGSDNPGDEILARLEALSLSRQYVARDRAHPTGTVSIKVGAAGNPSFTIQENVAWDFIPQSQPLMELGKSINAVTFGTLAQRSEVSRATIRAFIRKIPSSVLCIFDINLRQAFYSREIIEWSLEACHVLKLNTEELPVLARLLSMEGDERRLLSALSRRFHLKLVALTMGAGGSLLYSQERIYAHDGYKTDVVDTVGSGDAFTAALALGMLSGSDLATINDYANRVASFVCSKRGATPPLPDDLKITRWLNSR